MSKIRTAILGYGRNGSTMHAEPIEKNDDFEMVAVCDIDPQRQKQAAERFGCTTYTCYREMLEKERLDLVCVITRSDQHCEMSCNCLKAGVNVLVTKPWAANTAEAEKMVGVAQKTGMKLLPWLPSRWGSEYRRLREHMESNTIGKVFSIRRAVTSYGTRNDWQTESQYAGGYLLNWGPHIIEPPVLLAGGNVKNIYGRLNQIINPGDVEDIVTAMITMENGITVQSEFTVTPVTMPGWLILGDRGTITVQDNEMTIVTGEPKRPDNPTQFKTMKGDGKEITTERLKGNPYGDQFEIYREIAAAIRDEQVFAVQPEDALQLSTILDAVRTSHTTNQLITPKRNQE